MLARSLLRTWLFCGLPLAGFAVPTPGIFVHATAPAAIYHEGWIDFCKNSKRGLLGLEGVTKLSQNESEEQYFED